MAETKTLYHTELRGRGKCEMKVLSNLTESAKKKGSFYFTVELDGKTRYLNPENSAVSMALENRKGQTLTVEATGSRDDADLIIHGESDAQPSTTPSAPRQQTAPESHQQAQSRAQRQAPAAVDPAQEEIIALKAAKVFCARNAVLAKVALKALDRVMLDREKQEAFRELPPEVEVAIFQTILYGATAAGIPQRLPLNVDSFTLEIQHTQKGGVK